MEQGVELNKCRARHLCPAKATRPPLERGCGTKAIESGPPSWLCSLSFFENTHGSHALSIAVAQGNVWPQKSSAKSQIFSST